MALFLKAEIIRKHAGHHSAYCIGKHQRRKLAAGQDIISDRNFLINILIYQTLIHSLIVAAEYGERIIFRIAADSSLIECIPLGRHIDKIRTSAERAADILKAQGDRLSHHQHTHSAPVGRIVHSFMLVKCKIPQLVAHYLYCSLFPCPADYAFAHDSLTHFRKKGNYINPHHRTTRLLF